MDQDAFRQLLATSRQSRLDAKQAVLVTANSKPQKATTSALSGPGFKPRKVKKTESKYRDRATERRDGTGNDYADVEAVLDDFEKRVAHEDKDAIEEKRKYLGGDSQHTILVKGLDMSLLEQNRARVAASTEDDEILEQAFTEATSKSETTESRKRTRKDIVRELKAKRQNGDKSADQPSVEQSVDEGSALEVAKKAGKFRPIGFKPIGQTEEKPQKRKVKEGKEGVKKKRIKVESTSVQSGTNNRPTEETPELSHDQERRDTAERSSSKAPRKTPEPEPAPLDEDFDIFAGAGDYEAFPDDEESEEEHHDMIETTVSATQEVVSTLPAVGTKGWFSESEPEVRQASIPPEKSPPIPETEEEPQEIRLRPLESSALPSIRDFLAMDEAVEKAEKRKARKEKKKKKTKAGDDDDDD
ncbi:RED-like protein N-terminal region domain containing protein [Tylopilus felleus]